MKGDYLTEEQGEMLRNLGRQLVNDKRHLSSKKVDTGDPQYLTLRGYDPVISQRISEDRKTEFERTRHF